MQSMGSRQSTRFDSVAFDQAAHDAATEAERAARVDLMAWRQERGLDLWTGQPRSVVVETLPIEEDASDEN